VIRLLPGHDPGALREVLRWVDPLFGPIRRLERRHLEPPHPRWWVYACDLSRVPPGTWYSSQLANAAGASLEPDEALRRALGEAVERYAGLHPPPEGALQRLRAGEGDLWGRYPRCAPDEPCPLSMRRLDSRTLLTHVRARRLTDDRPVVVPAGMAFLSFAPEPREPPVAIPISTGLAFHAEAHRALWNGLCEAVERDAVMLAWWTRRSPPRIEIQESEAPDRLAERLERIRRAGLGVHLFDITSDIPLPTVLCVVTGDRAPYASVGAACVSDPEAAATKAVDEAVYIRLCFGERPRELPSLKAFGWVRTLEDHGQLYAGWRGSPALEFLLGALGPVVTFAELAARKTWPAPVGAEDLALRGKDLEALGLTPLWVDLTVPEARPLGRVVKVIVPELVPMTHDHRARWLATPRLLQHAGVRRASAAAFNPYPQPMA
jgi:ribosomal protein S12 methylthiotransferase accessory factor